MMPSFGIADAYGGYTAEYFNALGFFLLLWGVFNLFLLIASFRFNVVYILIFTALELCLCFDAAAQFIHAGGNIAASNSFMTIAGAFAFIASVLGYYAVLHYLCQESLPFRVSLGDTSRFFKKPSHLALKDENGGLV
ncbi:hypothetical protein QQS21_006457 [Conoideocrella luteorostrata]|uniref:Uncharacterized protein n=1 Tax=Conoideocrella luteorostrata TaxID=1105319 RepID=A0AAJ0FTE8_9HYPO|nr:hypothetical protein QQS21_006457 [Conoideocrella luteorostrata]